MRKFFGQIVGVHISVCRNEHFLCAVFNKRKIAAPFVFNPYCVKELGLGSQHDHYLRTIQRCKDIGFISRAELIFKGDAGKENFKSLLGELMIQIVCQNTVGSTATIVVGFLVADKHIKRLFLLRNGKNTLLNFVNCFGFFLVN